MFRLRRMGIDTQSEHVVFIDERAVHEGALGFNPMDRVRVIGTSGDETREIEGILNFCHDALLDDDEIGLSEVAFQDMGLAPGSPVEACLARPPESVGRVREKLRGHRLSRSDFDLILEDVVARRYSKPELSMFVLACALQNLDDEELIAFTRAMVDCGSSLDFDAEIVADKHCIGGIPGNRTTMIVVPILAALGVTIPKTSSRAITSPAGTADTMGVLADVDLAAPRIHRIVEEHGGCVAWGGALDLAPADDVLITVERPMQIDTEAQMVASILAKKKTAGATHALIDIPVGRSAKVRSEEEADELTRLFHVVAAALELHVDVVVTDARGPVGRGVGPRLEALDVLSVLRREPDAPQDLREKSLYLAARLLERTGSVPDAAGYHTAQKVLDSGRAEATFQRIVAAQGERKLPAPARFQQVVETTRDGRIREIDCLEINRIAKLAGAPANVSAGVRLLHGVGDIVSKGDPLFEIHAQSEAQLGFARDYAAQRNSHLFGY
ncbi:MAG: thymidine phosphorylase family protein [Deltaproteobacteria bacterium]|jgi:thymidine phosphorylase|nr:thymidine phosphorylase family protein [Deltaproteobacteria bacterium]